MFNASPITQKMMSLLAKWIFAVQMVIAPPAKLAPAVKTETVEQMTERYEDTAIAMASVIESRGSLFKGKEGTYRTAAVMLAITKFESELARDVAIGQRRGDNNTSYCYMQINVSGSTNIWGDDEMKKWTGLDLVSDWTKCFSVGHEILRISLRGCWNFKNGDILSLYTKGKCTEHEKYAQHRWNLAQWILRTYPPAPESLKEDEEKKEASL